MTDVIDAHVHLWPADGRDDITVTRDFPHLAQTATVEELTAMLARNGIAQAIAVQSAPTIKHSDWLVETCETVDEIVAVVGWIDVAASDAVAQIERLAAQPKVRGYRIMLNRMDDPSVIAGATCDPAFEATSELGLTVECLAPPAFLLRAVELAKRHPRLSVVVDHCGLPPIDALTDGRWLKGIAAVAAHPNTSTKLANLVEAYRGHWQVEDIRALANHVATLFGSHRLMAASNFPVVQIGDGPGASEDAWLTALDALFPSETYSEIASATARRAFGIS